MEYNISPVSAKAIEVSALQTWEKSIMGTNSEHPLESAKSGEKNPAGKVSLYQGDITRLEVDAIVNAGNTSLSGGSGGKVLQYIFFLKWLI